MSVALRKGLLSLAQWAVATYLMAAVIYTTHRMLVRPLAAAYIIPIPPRTRLHGGALLPRAQLAFDAPPSLLGLADPRTGGFDPSASDLDLNFALPDHDFDTGWIHHSVPANASGTQEERTAAIYTSKAFARARHPSRIIPFYYRAARGFDADDVTIATLVTENRFRVFSELVERYPGPISATVHVPTNRGAAHTHALLQALHALYTSSPSFAQRVDVHVVRDAHGRQLNAWRNVARAGARTRYIMMLDVDFAVCTDVRGAVRGALATGGEVGRRLSEGRAALVVPAFEHTRLEEGTVAEAFPHNKEALLALIKDDRIGMFHRSWAPGHNSSDYERFYASPPGAVYRVPPAAYQPAYEPYVVFRKDAAPWCDERFVGYGGNKAACLFEMYLSGMSFYVLADHFLIHRTHAYEEEARKQERKHNRKIYADFKEETCLRYLKRYYDEGTLNTTRGYNVQYECKKIKGVAGLTAEMLDSSRLT